MTVLMKGRAESVSGAQCSTPRDSSVVDARLPPRHTHQTRGKQRAVATVTLRADASAIR